MAASLAADAVLLLHGVFILFVVAGGLLALRWPLAAALGCSSARGPGPLR